MTRVRPARISLLLADVDGTLVTRDKVLTERARAAVHVLHAENIRFAVTSGRPPRGMAMLIDPLKIDIAVAGFNGGIFVNPDLTVIEAHTLPPKVAETAAALIAEHGLDVWVYRGNEWFIAIRKDRMSRANNGR
jgi:HAD superfamily hydrolase (TIGR01484 family)